MNTTEEKTCGKCTNYIDEKCLDPLFYCSRCDKTGLIVYPHFKCSNHKFEKK
jgi:hypothetical protein